MSAPDTARSTGRLRAILVAIAGLAVAVPGYVVTHAPTITPTKKVVRLQRRIVPQAELPPVEPVEFVALSPIDARSFNDAVPFSTEPNPAARPFRLAGGTEDRTRATDCLAAAVLYEAGDDAAGERAVAQVVLNRLRHPAFPKTVCGVVFEGSERSTGCQFSFTCDGAVARWKPAESGWRRARQIATAALAGSVYRPVGHATHYHTDWVVPYWQSSLEKVAAVHTHLFFRWSGWWGTPPAFGRRPASGEPVIAQLASISDAHRLGAALGEADAALAEAALVTGAPAPALASDPNSFLVTLPSREIAENFPLLAEQTCGDRPLCKYSAWSDRAKTPTTLPLEPAQIASMTFSYLRDRTTGYQKALWNCQQIKRRDPTQCMKVQVFMNAAPVMPAPGEPVVPVLGGVRRVTEGKAVAPKKPTAAAAGPGTRSVDPGARLRPAPAQDERLETGRDRIAPVRPE